MGRKTKTAGWRVQRAWSLESTVKKVTFNHQNCKLFYRSCRKSFAAPVRDMVLSRVCGKRIYIYKFSIYNIIYIHIKLSVSALRLVK